jgi:signal transduction histidine kinase
MTPLRRTLAWQIVAVIVCLLVTGAAAVWGIRGLKQDFSVALQGQQQLRDVYEVGSRLQAARSLVNFGQPDRANAELRAAKLAIENDPELTTLAGHLDKLLELPADQRTYQLALGETRQASTRIQRSIGKAQERADRKQNLTITAVAALAGVMTIGAVLIGVMQYRAVVRHTQLEQEVAEKNRELVRSQRLASVGFLAAGVAHEINNPLGIITGFAEFTQEQLTSAGGDEATVKALQTICDEAFRCKGITEKLLSMARVGETEKTPVDLSTVARDVIGLTTVLKPYQGRRVQLTAEPAVVSANEAEMKQVVLNLLTNALEAIDETGEVRVNVRRGDQAVELSVKDTGRGMSGETMNKIFEPFFTLPRNGRRGTGLGLSIAHAIVESHGGTIRASSDGEGKGSEFVVTLPA